MGGVRELGEEGRQARRGLGPRACAPLGADRTKDLDPGAVGGRPFHLGAAARVDREPEAARAARDLLGGPRLPHPGLTGEEQPRRPPRASLSEGAVHVREDPLAAHEDARGQTLERLPIHPALFLARPALGGSPKLESLAILPRGGAPGKAWHRHARCGASGRGGPRMSDLPRGSLRSGFGPATALLALVRRSAGPWCSSS